MCFFFPFQPSSPDGMYAKYFRNDTIKKLQLEQNILEMQLE
jgi:hypothetical protein